MTTIDEVLDAFLAEQEQRLAARTFRNYLEVIELFRHCMNGYGHSSLTKTEVERWEASFEAGDEDAFTRLFGPEKIPGEIGQFLGWYVIAKVMPGQELARACGTVTKKLGEWLVTNGHLDAAAAADIEEWAVEAGDTLPKAEKLSEILYAESRRLGPLELRGVREEEWIEDQLLIERVESGELWFEGDLGPVEVPEDATDLARPGWAVTISLARIDGR